MKKNKPDSVVWDDTQENYIAKLLPYASNISGPIIEVPNVDAFKKKGVDKKHGSYARYLARKTGKVLRQETSETVVGRTAVIANKRTISKGSPSEKGLWWNTCCEQATDPSPQGRLPTIP